MDKTLIKAKLLGRFEVWRREELLSSQAWPQRKTRQLFKLLLTERGHFFTQDQLIEALFPELELEKATRSLHNRISELRRVLEPNLSKGADSQFVLHAGLKGYSFSKEALCWLDTEEFEKQIKVAQDAENAGRWTQALESYQKAIELYHGDFLPEDLYEEWTLAPRERWRELYLKVLARLAECYARFRQFSKAIESCQRVLEREPWHEGVYRQKMLYHYHAGEHSEAVQTFQACIEALKTHLQVEPSAGTKELYEQILQHEVSEMEQVYPTNLPHALTSFIGREREIVQVKSLLTETRLLTLTGAGGSGKTRLALRVASELLKDYLDGIWWIDLAPLTDSALLPNTIALVLGLSEASARPVQEFLIDHFRLKTSLLVLDNCEHLIDACAHLSELLLRACPDLKILTTSREVLGLEGETVWSVPTLSIPESQPLPTLKILQQYEAISLFIERARASQPGFTLREESALSVTQICQQLDGLPLAIELAAARLKALSVEQIATRLEDRFKLLTSQRRTSLPKHHQTLRAAMDWSYDLLSEAEQALLRRLSVFAGGFTLEAVEGVCANDDPGRGGSRTAPTEILDLLTHLVEKSLVVFERRGKEARYRFLETVREYGREKLREAHEEEIFQQQHFEWFLALAEKAEPELQGSRQKEWLEALEREHDNLRASLACSLESNAVEARLRLAGALWRFWYVRGYLSEGRQWLKEMLTLDSKRQTPSRAKALNGLGALASSQGDLTSAKSFFEESLALSRERGDLQSMCLALRGLGVIALDHQDYALARSRLEESLNVARRLEDQKAIVNALTNLGVIETEQGNFSTAHARHEESLAISRGLGDSRSAAFALRCLGTLASDQGDYPAARAYAEESLAICRELGDKRSITMVLNNLGATAMTQGDYATARSRLEEGLVIAREMGDKTSIGYPLYNLGDLARRQGNHKQAQSCYEESLAIAQATDEKRLIAYCLEGLGGIACAQGHLERSGHIWGAADALREAIGVPLTISDRTEYEKNVGAARAGLGKTAFATAWAEGRAMTLEQAIGYALDTSTK